MAHWRKMMDPRDYIYCEDLAGRDVDVQIERVAAGELAGEKGRKSKKPLAFFKGKGKPLALNKTNCKTIASIVGSNDTDDWVGQWITLFPSTTQDPSGNQVECVRIRPRAPRRGQDRAPSNGRPAPQQPDPQPSVATSDAEPVGMPGEPGAQG